MGRLRIGTFQFRQALVRLCDSETVREIGRNGLMGRGKHAAAMRTPTEQRGWPASVDTSTNGDRTVTKRPLRPAKKNGSAPRED